MSDITEFRLPAILAKIGPKLPQWPHACGLALGLRAAQLLRWLKADTWHDFEGKVVGIRVIDAGIDIKVRCAGGQFRPAATSTAADVTFSGTLMTFLRLLRRDEDPDTLFFNRKLMIEGNTALGLQIKNVLDAVEWPAWMAGRA